MSENLQTKIMYTMLPICDDIYLSNKNPMLHLCDNGLFIIYTSSLGNC